MKAFDYFNQWLWTDKSSEMKFSMNHVCLKMPLGITMNIINNKISDMPVGFLLANK